MPIPQQKFREIVFQALYSHDMSSAQEEDMLPLLTAELAVSKTAVKQAQTRLRAIVDKLSEIDALIKQKSQSYDFNRIHTVERNILRLGIFELLYDQTIPHKVAIAEALRLAKKFGSPESVSFVNAILDAIYKERIKIEE